MSSAGPHSSLTELVRSAGQPGTEIIDLHGKAVIPGLVDSHAHMDREGLKDIYPSLKIRFGVV